MKMWKAALLSACAMVGSQAEAITVNFTAVINGPYTDFAHYDTSIPGTDYDNSTTYNNQLVAGSFTLGNASSDYWPSIRSTLSLTLPSPFGSLSVIGDDEVYDYGHELRGGFDDLGHYGDSSQFIDITLLGDNLFADPNDLNSLILSHVAVGSTFEVTSNDSAYIPDLDQYYQTVKAYDIQGSFLSFSSANAVPEPASWAMMIGGVGFAGGALRRKRSVRVAYA